MQTANDLISLNGLFKKVYATVHKDLLPDGVKLLKEVPFVSKAERQGASYNQAIVLGMEHGVTYGGSTGTAFNLNGAIAGNVLQAEVKGHEMILEAVIALATISRSENKEGAFIQATKHVVKNMLFSMHKRLEIQMFYGQEGLAAVDSVAAQTVTIADEDWAPGIWSGGQNMKVEFRNAAGTASRGEATLTTVNLSTRELTFSDLPATVQATDIIWYKGAFGKEFPGVHRIITNSSSLYGIDSSQYDLWRGNEYAVNGPLTLDSVEEAVTLAVDKGLEEGKITLYCSTAAWNDLLAEQTAKRRFDYSYDPKEAEAGHQKIRFHSQAGVIEVVPSTHVKRGSAYLLSVDEFRRVGSQDVSFERPGKGGEYIYDLPNTSGFGLRLYTDQSLFCEAPGRNVILTGITPGQTP
jgi:hypothetical protein